MALSVETIVAILNVISMHSHNNLDPYQADT